METLIETQSLIKGTGLQNIEKYLNKELDPQYFITKARQIGLLNDSQTVIPFKWYSFEMVMQITEEAANKLGMKHGDLLFELSRNSLVNDLNNIYKFFMKINGAEGVLKKATSIARTYANFWNYEILENSKGIHKARFTTTHKYLECSSFILKGALTGILEVCNKRAKSISIEMQNSYNTSISSALIKVNY